MTTLLAFNPFCRDGDTDWERFADVLREDGDVVVHRLDDETPLKRRIAEIGPRLRRIVLAGGDGTLNRALADVIDAGVPVGVLPLGTANDFARSLALPDDPVEAAQVIVEGHTRSVDVGMVNGHPFLNAVGIGLGPALTRSLDREKKKRLGVLAYLDSLVQVIGRRRRHRAQVVVDGASQRLRFLQITIANGRHYGGGMTVSDEARVDDERLHVLCLRPLTPWQLFLRGLRFRFGAVRDDEKLIYRQGRQVEVRTRYACDVTADGEMVTCTPVRCSVRPGLLTVYVPRATEDDATRDAGKTRPADTREAPPAMAAAQG